MCQSCDVLHAKMKEQSEQMWQMRKTITNLRGELKYEKIDKRKLLKERRQHTPTSHQKRTRNRRAFHKEEYQYV